MDNSKDNIQSVIEVSKYLFENKLVSGKAGNVSVRFKDNGMDDKKGENQALIVTDCEDSD